MVTADERIMRLREKAKALPDSAGVYLMKNADGRIIYVGKAKILKNRVSSYFVGIDRHLMKVKRMVEHVEDFDYIVCASDMEAIVLECSQIKHYMPRYNILLKDDKSYPYVKLTMNEQYPQVVYTRRREDDKGKYFGPYSGNAGEIIKTIQKTFKLPSCNRKFPQDIGKGRPCLNYSIKNCMGLCTGNISHAQYMEAVLEAAEFLDGRYKDVIKDLGQKMEAASQELRFEEAARLRDRLAALKALGERQKVVTSPGIDRDVIALASDESRTCIMVLYIREGRLAGTDSFVVDAEEFEDTAEGMAAFVKQHYLLRADIPKEILLSDTATESELLEEYLSSRTLRKVHIKVPQRGEPRRSMKLALGNAKEGLEKAASRQERIMRGVAELGKICGLDALPVYIEALDISNTAGSEVVGGLIAFKEGKPSKKDYKRFKVKTVDGQDDYDSMREIIWRRFKRYKEGADGFAEMPDLLLLDGGKGQLSAVLEILNELEIDIPVFGMVKDDRHRTRGLIGTEGEINPSPLNPGFVLMGRIQEEVHRYAIAYHRSLRGKKTFSSVLTEIEGIGQKRAAALLTTFKSLDGIRAATEEEIASVKGMSLPAARAVKEHL